MGTLLKICPLLNVDCNGKLVARAKVRSKHKVIKEIADRMIDNAQDGLDYADKCFLSHSYCPEDAKAVAELVKASFTKLKGEARYSRYRHDHRQPYGPGYGGAVLLG